VRQQGRCASLTADANERDRKPLVKTRQTRRVAGRQAGDMAGVAPCRACCNSRALQALRRRLQWQYITRQTLFDEQALRRRAGGDKTQDAVARWHAPGHEPVGVHAAADGADAAAATARADNRCSAVNLYSHRRGLVGSVRSAHDVEGRQCAVSFR
jgi:hypothetical protein